MSIRDNLTEEEKQIYALITAAKDQGIITAYKDDGKYISCKLDDIKYEISLGFNPDYAHPSAERAIRASRFVTRLMDKIRKDFSCYYVQSENSSYPHEDVLMDKLNSGRTQKITQVVYHDQKVSGDDCFVSSYEIEVEIVASVGEKYERMVDFLTVEMNSKGAAYTHKHIISPGIITKNIAPDEETATKKRANEILNFVLDGQLPGKRKDENIRKNNIRNMLQALAQSKDSHFREFLDRASAEDAKVGQISVKPCSLLIDAVDEKEYVYKVSFGNDTGDLSVIWRSNIGDFNEDTQLYLQITPMSKFIGLTNVKTSHPINNFNLLVLAHKAEMKKGEIVITPDRWTLNDTYKQYINNYAVPVERDGVTRYFSKQYAVLINGKWRLSLDCERCALSGQMHYKGDLDEKFYLKDGQVKFGKIYTTGVPCFCCETCLKIIYYLNQEHIPYLLSHTLLDGECYCDYCNDTVRRGDYKYKKTENVANGDKIGTVYALMDGNDLVPIEKGGNVFVCANCGKTVLYDDKTENNTCAICSEHICSHCANNKNGAPDRPMVVNLSTYACKHCLEKSIIQRKGENMMLYRVEDSNGQEQLVLDNAEHPALLFHCVECGKLRYRQHPNLGTHKKCSACGRIICSSCMDKHTAKDNCLGLTFCSNCATQCNTSVYKTAKSQAEEYYHKLRNQETKLKYDDLRKEQDLQKHVINNIKKYLPHFSMADRKTVRLYIKKGKTGTAIQHISCQTVAILEKSTNYKFTVTVLGGKTYLFYLIKNKLISGGIYDGRI